jgi:hypothetical protein
MGFLPFQQLRKGFLVDVGNGNRQILIGCKVEGHRASYETGA